MRPANAAETDDPHTLAGQFHQRSLPEAEVRTIRPLTGLNRICMLLYMMAKLQQQGKNVLGHGVGTVYRHVGNRDATLAGRIGVHHIKPSGQYSDELQIR